MDANRRFVTLLLIVATALPSGCGWQRSHNFEACVPPGIYEQAASQIEYPAESDCTLAGGDESLDSPQPWTIATQGTPVYWDLSLEEAIQLTLANSQVLRDVGGAVVRAPDAVRTTMGPAIAETDPRTGIEAALSEFDAQFLTSTYWEKNHRALNNEFFGGGTRILYQDAGVFQAAITKRSVTGSQFWIRHNVDYDANNAPGNRFDSAWNANVEMEMRHPLLQGSGTEFNRIAGISNVPGQYNGVLLARLNTDVALSDFEIAVRDLVSNVENAYWDLYYGYRVLDARIVARDAALDTWRKIYALYEVDRRGGEADKEAQAREQYFRFQQDVQNAMSGEPYEQTRNWNGQPSGSFRSTGGVLLAERRLRLLMGLAPSDGRLLRPKDEPVLAQITFDWEQVREEATTRRTELRRQKWQIRRRELELIASKNFLLPRLDAVGRYRWRGFGDDLFPKNEPPLPRFDNAYGDLTSGAFQEWQLGFELSMPIGFRHAHTAVRNAELLLARERALLRDQQREIMHEAADAISEMDRAYMVLQTSYNRLKASHDQLQAVTAAYEEDKAPLDLVLEAQRRRTESETEYNLNRARYAVATKNVHFVKGTLLEYDGVYLAEGPWPGAAYHDAAEREARRGRPIPLNYSSSTQAVSRGIYPQLSGEPSAIHGETTTFGSEQTIPAPFGTGDQPITQPESMQPPLTPPSSEQPLPPPGAPETSPPASPPQLPPREEAGAAGDGSATIGPASGNAPAPYDAFETAVPLDDATAERSPPLRLPSLDGSR
jgi:outer membrane protein TolC